MSESRKAQIEESPKFYQQVDTESSRVSETCTVDHFEALSRVSKNKFRSGYKNNQPGSVSVAPNVLRWATVAE